MISYTDSEAHAATTAATRTVLKRFVQVFYVEREVRRAFETFVAPDYIQHNPGIADGREAAVAALEPMFANPESNFDLKRMLVDGEYGVIQLHGYRTGQRGGAVMDMYRVADGKIVEHWDVIQEVPDTARNDHPLF